MAEVIHSNGDIPNWSSPEDQSELNGSSRDEGLGGLTGLLSVFVPHGFSVKLLWISVCITESQ